MSLLHRSWLVIAGVMIQDGGQQSLSMLNQSSYSNLTRIKAAEKFEGWLGKIVNI